MLFYNPLKAVSPFVYRLASMSKYLPKTKDYYERVTLDLGTVRYLGDVNTFYKFLEKENLYSNTELLWFGDAGIKTRETTISSTPLTFVSKGYSLDPTPNDLTQTTELDQPYLSGNIAPNEKLRIKNLLDILAISNRLRHPAIILNEFTLTLVFNSFGTTLGSQSRILGNLSNIDYNLSYVGISNNIVTLGGANGISVNHVGKNTILTITKSSEGVVKYYINGILKSTTTTAVTDYLFNALLSGYYRSHPASVFYYRIQSSVITEAQVEAEHTLLRSIFPEIESVQIGTQTWATSNLEMVATPMGNVIPEVQLATATERLSGGDFEGGLIGSLTSDGDETATWTLNTTNPISGTQDGRLVVSVAGMDMGSPAITFTTTRRTVGQWRKLTFNFKVNSGNCILQRYYRGQTSENLSQDLVGSSTFTRYYKVDGSSSNLILYFDGTNTFDVQLDNISDIELGWADRTELYNGLIAQGMSVANATKEAAAWCYYNNDPNIGAVYGKLYNWYAAKLIQNDIDAYNAANPSTPWGWRVPSIADYFTLTDAEGRSLEASYKYKTIGLDYWNLDNGHTNSNGFSAIGNGRRDSNGSFLYIKLWAHFWSYNSLWRMQIHHTVGIAYFASTETFGLAIRLIKDE